MATYYMDKDGNITEMKTSKKKKQKKEGMFDFFQNSGAFDDGYQLGDVSTTILGTATDALLEVGKGAAGMAEGIADFGRYGIAGIADKLGNDEYAQKLRKKAKVNSVEELTRSLDDELEPFSILGKTSDSVFGGIGQVGTLILTGGLAGAAGLGAAGTTAVTTGLMGASGMGSGMSQAYQEGATDKEAMIYGAIAGGAEALSEMLFGGLGKAANAVGFNKGLLSLDDAFARKIASKFSSQITKNLAEFGVKASAEGVEEVVSGIASALGKKVTYMKDNELVDLLKDENLMEQFIVGAVTSGISQSGIVPGMRAGSLIESNKTGRDFIDGMTETEKKVVDKEVENRVAESEKSGKKLTDKERAKIREEVIEDMDKGGIGFDTIASALNSDAFEAYKKAFDEEEPIFAKYEELDKVANRSAEQQAQYDELSEQVKNSQRKKLGSQMMREIHEATKDSRLNATFQEAARRKQKYQADPKKTYKTKEAQETLDNIVKSGLMDNSNKSRDFVDFMTNISDDRGYVFEVTNTERLKESVQNGNPYKINVDPTKVEAFVDGKKKRIIINLDAGKSLNSLVGHEITHTLEQAKVYKDLQDAIFQYAKTKGEYDSRLADLKKRYEGVDADINMELTSDLVGNYLFTDSDFVKNLSVEKPSLFKRIYDEIKYLWKMATAGSQEARELERVKRAFDKAWKEAGQSKTDGSSIKYSLSQVDGIDYVNAEKHTFLKEDGTIASEREIFDSLVGKTISLPDGDVKIVKRLPGKDMYNELAKRYPRYLDGVDDVKELNRNVNHNMEELLTNSETIKWNEPDVGGRHQKQGISSFDTRTVKFYDGNKAYDIEFSIATLQNGEKIAYAKKFFGYDEELTKKIQATEARSEKSPLNQKPVSNSILSLQEENVKSLLTDIDGKPIVPERISSNESDNTYSLTYAKDIAEGQSKYASTKGSFISDAELAEAQRVTDAMVDVMMKYSSILPEDKIGKVLTKNGSYDRSVENTTICVRTLAYNEFVDKVQEQIGRPLTQMESFLVSQKLYDIATEPQCMYCYVSLDRKSFNEMLLRYMNERDTVIDKYKRSDRMPDTVEALYEEFLNGRKNTREMRKRFNDWISYVDNGTQLLSLADIATEDRQSAINANGGVLADQLKEARKYAQSASWSKIQKNYVAYRDEILKLGDRVVKNLNEHYGLRWYSFSDYSAAFIVENMQQITDASIRGLKGLAYTKDTDFAEVFAPSGMNINVSVFVNQDKNGNFFIDERQSANFEKAMELRNQYPNVGIVATVTNDEALRWAASQEWSDVIIPFHIVRTGTDVAEYYKWLNYTSESGDTIKDKNLWDAYVDSLNIKSDAAKKKVSKNIYPNEHKNDKTTYLTMCENRGLTPRFARFAGEDWYMKLVNETRLSAEESTPLKPTYNLEAAQASFQKFVDKGGYEGGWYKDGVDVDAEAGIVAGDVLAGKKANEVSYGRQDGYDPESILASRKANRNHGQYSLASDIAPTREYGDWNIYGSDVKYQDDIAPVKATPVQPAPSYSMTPGTAVDAPVADEAMEGMTAPELSDGKIRTVKERLAAKLENFQTELANNINLRNESNASYDEEIARLETEYASKRNKDTAVANNLLRRIERMRRMKGNVDADYAKRISDLEDRVAKTSEELRTGNSTSEQGAMRAELHASIINNAKKEFEIHGFDFDEVLKNAKNLSTFSTVDNTPQRVMEKALGYKEGQVLSDITVNKVAQNETEGIKWLNSYTDRKSGVLVELSKRYNIKPGSKESAAAQMYAEGFYVDADNNIIEYGDRELAMDFPDARVRENIKGLSRDPMIRQIYDETLDMINASRARNAYPEIQKLKNYFLHFRAMDDTFSKLGLPFNPNDIRAKDLPTDLNGVTADLKPGQPYFASAMHRTGQRTSFDLLGGLERYLTSAKNQIYHIDDIQTLRAIRNYIADNYGQAKGLESLDTMTEEEAQDRIQRVYNSHLSTFAKFLNEEANVIAGKTALIDRGIEGIIGRRGITFLNTVNGQVGKNMVGFNVSSSLTNFLPVVQTFAKGNKASFVKAFAQTVSNKLGSITGKSDGFAEQSPVMIRRRGADAFYRTPFQKVGDAGYALMSAVDNISTELIARTKYNELVKNGMESETAHVETDKWVSRLMGDRSLGQQPQLYNSKMLGLVTKFQLEVRNQLDSQFYDTIQEAKASNEDIQNGLNKNAKTAAKVASTFVQLAVVQHLFGKAFESVAGYNPAFDIIEVLMTAFGFDDEEDSEDTALDNIEQGFLALLEDLPYASTVMDGGRIPISDALPIGEFIKGVDEYGNEKSRWDIAAEVAPYYILPGGYGQYKKTKKGLDMFSDKHPISGSYTDSGNLRFPVDDNLQNRLQAGIFGQWANENARDYFDNGRDPLKEKQIQEFIDLDMPIRDYWDYREGLKEQETLEDKFNYIAGQDLTVEQKNIMINNIVDRKEKVDMSNYDDFSGYEEFDFYSKNAEKYNFLQANNVSYSEYKSSEDAKKEYDTIYNWSKQNPQKVAVSKLITDNVVEYRRLVGVLDDIPADKNAKGNSISGSKKKKVTEYINGLDLEYGQKIILFKSQYEADDTYNADIVEYLNSRDDLSYEDIVEILTELNFKVTADGTVTWD